MARLTSGRTTARLDRKDKTMGKVDGSADTDVHYRTCPFCDQHCGTEVSVDRATQRVVSVRGDKSDPLSKGYICPKVYALKDYHHDPERLTGPMIKRNGRFEAASWDEALDFAASRIKDIQREYGDDAIAFYFGTGLAHVPALCLYTALLATALNTRQVYSSSSVDCHAHFLAPSCFHSASTGAGNANAALQGAAYVFNSILFFGCGGRI